MGNVTSLILTFCIRGGSRNLERGHTVRGAAPGRVREGGTPPAQPGGMGESAGSSPIGAWGGALEANAFCVVKAPKTTQKSRPV